MSAQAAVANVTASSMGIAAAGAAAAAVPLEILGVPMWGLLAGLVGAFCSYIPRRAVDKLDIPTRMLGILSDALIGSWLAVAATKLTALSTVGIHAMPIEILCGMAAFAMQWLRKKAGPIFEQIAGGLVVAITSTITSWSRRGGNTPPPRGGPE